MPLTTVCAQPAHTRNSPEKSETNDRDSLSKLQASQHVTSTEDTTTPISRCLLLALGYFLFFLGTAAVPWLGLKLIESCGLFPFPFDLSVTPPLSAIQVWQGILVVGIVGTAFFMLVVSAIRFLFDYGFRA